MKRKGRKPQPWWWEERKGYYATINGVRYRLAETKKAAAKQLENLESELTNQQRTEVKPEDDPSVFALLQAFLNWTKENRSSKTHKGYFDFCESFNGRYPLLLVSELSPKHVDTWLAEQKTWNSTTKRGAITCLQRAFNWAVTNRGLPRNPLAGMEKPEAKRRTQVITEPEFKRILEEVADPAFRELLIISYDLGCRPSESKMLTAAHFELSKRRAVIETEWAKGKRAPRAIYIATDRAMKIIKNRIKMNMTGPILRNMRGRPWTASAVKCRFARLEKKLGKRYNQTAFRHTWITRKLVAGVDSHVVAALSGHSDSSMIDRVYSHVADDHAFMLAAAKKGA